MMNKNNGHINTIKDILIAQLQPNRIWLFGSRAEGKNRISSDYDLAFEGGSSSFRDLRKAKEMISGSIGIYSCDIVDLDKVSNDFKELIKSKGKVIHEGN